MKRITPDIALEDCGEKLEYYRDIFGGEIANLRKTPEGKVMHAELHIKPGCVLYFHDKFLFSEIKYGSVVLVLEMESEEEMGLMYNALKEGGGVRFDLQQTDWGAMHAVVEDRHSIVWSLNYML